MTANFRPTEHPTRKSSNPISWMKMEVVGIAIKKQTNGTMYTFAGKLYRGLFRFVYSIWATDYCNYLNRNYLPAEPASFLIVSTANTSDADAEVHSKLRIVLYMHRMPICPISTGNAMQHKVLGSNRCSKANLHAGQQI